MGRLSGVPDDLTGLRGPLLFTVEKRGPTGSRFLLARMLRRLTNHRRARDNREALRGGFRRSTRMSPGVGVWSRLFPTKERHAVRQPDPVSRSHRSGSPPHSIPTVRPPHILGRPGRCEEHQHRRLGIQEEVGTWTCVRNLSSPLRLGHPNLQRKNIIRHRRKLERDEPCLPINGVVFGP